jgi:hypothetical protein
MRRHITEPALAHHRPQPCVWLWDQWVGTAPTRILGTIPTLPLFGCESGFAPLSVWLEDSDGVGSIPFSVWLDGFEPNLNMVTSGEVTLLNL